MTELLEARDVRKVFFSGGFFKKQATVAVDSLSISIQEHPPSITAIAGESGSGKTTLGRLLLGLIEPTAGQVLYKGKPLASMSSQERRTHRREVQAIYQDPFGVYNPFYKVDHVLAVPIAKSRLASSRSEAREIAEEALRAVGLRPEETLGRYPHQLSGGQRQRVMVARALVLKPRVIIADEPVSMVDASLRATVLETLRDFNREFGISILYITHDLTTAYQIADNIIILYQGTVKEAGDVELVINDPQHPYTKLLVESIPQPDPKARWQKRATANIAASEADLTAPGCNFFDRCPVAMEMCVQTSPPMYRTDIHRLTQCYVYRDSPGFEDVDLSSSFVPPRELAGVAEQ